MIEFELEKYGSARVFERLERKGIEKALRDCLDAGYRPLFADELIEARDGVNGKHYLKKNWFTTASGIYTGRVPSGSDCGMHVVAVVNAPHYFLNPDNLRESYESMRNGAGAIPENYFTKLFEQEIDEDGFQYLMNIFHPVEKSKLSSVAFRMGGRFVSTRVCNDADVVPRGRVLFLSSLNNGLNGNYTLSNFGRFVGVAPKAPQSVPSLDEVLGVVSEFIAPANTALVREKLGRLYNP